MREMCVLRCVYFFRRVYVRDMCLLRCRVWGRCWVLRCESERHVFVEVHVRERHAIVKMCVCVCCGMAVLRYGFVAVRL